MNDQTKDPQREILSRTRRIETRLTQLLVTLGYDNETQKPIFAAGPPARLELPSPHSSMNEILASIPQDYTGPVDVVLGSKTVVILLVGPQH